MSRPRFRRWHLPGGPDGTALCGADVSTMFDGPQHPADCALCLRRRDNPDWNKKCRSCGKRLASGRVGEVMEPDPEYPGMHANCARLARKIKRDQELLEQRSARRTTAPGDDS